MPQPGTIIAKSIKSIRLLKKECSCDPQYQRILSSIKQFGQICPATISENNFLLDGHKVCKALHESGHTSVNAIQLKLRPDIQEAWEIHQLLNGRGDYKSKDAAAIVTSNPKVYQKQQSECHHFF